METTNRDSVMSVKDWLITILILHIPLVGIIMAFVWAFSDDTNKNKQTFTQAILIIAAVLIGIFILFGILAALI